VIASDPFISSSSRAIPLSTPDMPRNASVESEDPKAADSASGDEEEEEFEIEEVLDAKRGVFPDGRIGYFVKWKNYTEEHNSWVDELDAENAKDLVDEFWRKNPHKKRQGRKSLDKRPKKLQEYDSDGDSSTAKKKRGRKTSTKAESDDEMDVDQPVRKKKATRLSKTREPSQDDNDSEVVLQTMETYMAVKNWEHLVKAVDTVERESNGELYIYFTLTSGESVREKNDICKDRFPRKLLDFYEDNLRWRNAQEVDHD